MNNLKKNITSMIFHLLTFIITLGLIVGIDIYKFNFDWSKITIPYLYTRMLLSAGYVLIRISISNFTYDIREVSDKTYVELMIDLQEASKRNRGSDFNDKISRFDYQNKKDTWIRLVEKDLFKHERNIPKKILIEMSSIEPESYSRKTKKWIKKKDLLEDMLTDEWIYKNLQIHDIKYPEILPSEVLYGSIEYIPNKSMLDRIPLKRIIIKSLPSTLFSLIATTILGTLVSIESESGVGLFVAIAGILVILTTNVSMGILNGLKAHKSRLMNANIRSEIMIDYKDGIYNNLPEVPKRSKLNTHVVDDIEVEETLIDE